MEQVIHGPGVGPARPLRVTVEAPGWTVTHRGPQDELTLRAILRTELDSLEAATAATGWGNDTLVRVNRTGATGFAWVLRWDDAGEADEFAAALRRVVEARREAVGGGFAVVRVAPETVVLLTGSDAFVDAASAAGTNESVTVTVEGN